VRLDPTRDLLDAVPSHGGSTGTRQGGDGSRMARADSTHKKEPHSTHISQITTLSAPTCGSLDVRRWGLSENRPLLTLRVWIVRGGRQVRGSDPIDS
jgi:hypothetical protein